MSLLSSKSVFDLALANLLNQFFSNDLNSPYYVSPLDSEGNLKDETVLRAEVESKIFDFSQNLGNIIYNFIINAQVNTGIPVNTSGGSGATTGPGSIS